jgi:tetratricopeptide (TPR) repeat protein
MTRDIYQEADDLERTGRHDEAGERWREAVERTPSAGTLGRLGRFYLRQGQTNEGERLLRETIARFPDDPYPYFYLGVHYQNQDKLLEARALLQKRVDLEEWAPALISLGVVHWLLQAKDEARRYLARATTVDPSDSEAWSNLAATYVEDDSDHARALFEKAVGLDGENAFAARELGYLLWRFGEFQAAETHLRQAIALVDQNAWSHEYWPSFCKRPIGTKRQNGSFAEPRNSAPTYRSFTAISVTPSYNSDGRRREKPSTCMRSCSTSATSSPISGWSNGGGTNTATPKPAAISNAPGH